VALIFNNVSARDAYVALVVHDPGCSPNPWRKHGWYRIPNDNFLHVLIPGDLRDGNRYLMWFADWYSDGPSWGSGNPYWRYLVTDAVFNQCFDDNTGCDRRYDFQLLDINGLYGIVVNLLYPGAFTTYPDYPLAIPPWPDNDGDDDFGDDGGDDFGGDEG
jgi:hypothetical protein